MKYILFNVIFLCTIIPSAIAQENNYLLANNIENNIENKEIAFVEENSLVNLETDASNLNYINYKRRKRYSLRNKNLYSNRIYFKNKDYGKLLKTNILYDLTATLNVGFECSINRNNSVEFSTNLNPWEFGEKRWKQYSLAAEYRYWQDYAYHGLYYGGMIMYGAFDIGGFKSPIARPKKSDCWNKGNVFVIGVTVGWAWEIPRTRWGYEASFGLGYLSASYDKYTINGTKTKKPGELVKAGKTYSSVVPVKLGFTFSYKLNTHN